MTVCVKSEFVLERWLTPAKPTNVVIFRASLDIPVEKDNPDYFRKVVIDRKQWEDMGRPEKITATIEPGDKLNVGN